ncbi:MAG: M48 family metallopeptidase [Polaromonas sp.]|nr:M48 family metallopeptidase [Polaromonas sp.]
MLKLFQRTLDLFAPEPEPVQPLQQLQQLPAQTLAQALVPAISRHPDASREALLSGVLVGFALKRGKRRTIGFSVGPEGLSVSAPKWVPLAEIDRAVQEKASWVLKKLQETRERHSRMESARVDWQDGATVPFMGGELVLLLDPRQQRSAMAEQLTTHQPSQDDEAQEGALQRRVLHLGVAHNASATQIRDAAQAWLMRHAKQLFEERLNHYAPQLGVSWRRLSLSSAGTRWGSASADGSIRLNWRLIHFKLSVIDYVVVHELSHLRVMDHSPRFWDTVRAIVPDYAELRGQLKDELVPKW